MIHTVARYSALWLAALSLGASVAAVALHEAWVAWALALPAALASSALAWWPWRADA